MLRHEDIFNDYTLNIFTDASIYTEDKRWFASCPGAISIIGNTIIDRHEFIVNGSTNNEGEILAIRLGIYFALKYRDRVKQINLFSDSNICIQGLNNWIYSWVNNVNKNGILFTNSNKPVANQEIIKCIISDIVRNNLQINFYHVKGHVDIRNDGNIYHAMKVFNTSNGIDIDYKLAKQISYYNNNVDINTRNLLYASTINSNTETITAIKRDVNLKNIINQYKNNTQRNDMYGSKII